MCRTPTMLVLRNVLPPSAPDEPDGGGARGRHGADRAGRRRCRRAPERPFVLPASASTILSCTPSNFAASLASLTIVELRGSRGDPLGRQPRTNSRWVRHLDSKPALRPRLRFHGVELGIAVQL